MDPLSIIASSVTLLGACIAASEVLVDFISGIRNLDSQLEATLQDVTDFRNVLLELAENMRLEELLLQSATAETIGGIRAIAGRIPATSTEAQARIRRTRNKIVEIEVSVRKISSSTLRGRFQVLERKRLAILREDLRELKLSLSAHFSVKSGRVTLQSLVSLQHIAGFLNQASRERSHQGGLLNEIHDYMRHTEGLEDEQRRTRQLVEALNARMQHQCLITPPPTPPADSQEMIPRPSSTPQPANDSHSADSTQILASNDDIACGSVPSTTSEENTQQCEAYYSSVFKLDISRYRKHACQSFCACHCHRRFRRRTKGPLGRLALGYSNLPFARQACIEGCKSRSPFSATISYNFPAWFFLRVISLIFITSIFGDPWVGIKIRPVTTMYSIFRFSSLGDLEGLKKLLSRGETHPSASFYGGWTSLHYAISYGQAAICRLLINENADPMIEDGADSLSALEWAWIKILGKSFSSAKTLEFESIFTDRECLEEMGFTRFHKLVLGLERGDLSTELAASEEGAKDVPDFSGRTPLSWAAQRGDVDVVNTLLTNNANANLATPSGMTPLHYAAEAMEPTCIQPLLSHGASVNCADHALHTPLHMAAQNRNDTAYVKPLIEAGLDVNASTDYGFTPLVCAVENNYHIAARYLLDHGADVNGRGQYGKTAIFFAVEFNAHDCLSLLLERGAHIAFEADQGEGGPTIAHMAARFADLETVQILNAATLSYISLDSLSVEDHQGLLIDERINKRLENGELDRPFRAPFNAFMMKITDPAEISTREDQQDDSVEVFFDARET